MKMNSTLGTNKLALCPLKKDTMDDNGLILIADISGFTKFVHETDVLLGSKITRMLLSSIMDSNILKLKVSEIEGDAILFYKYGSLPTVCSILRQYEVMLNNFNTKLKKIKLQFKTKIELSLKVIVHVGKMTRYTIGKFNKLYGESVIEAHRLLKNPITSKSYVLMTEDLIKTVVDQTAETSCVPNAKRLSKTYDDDKPLEFTYYDYESHALAETFVKHNCVNSLHHL